jgi:heterodisulfide reductase subunit A-like polyferredoxin
MLTLQSISKANPMRKPNLCLHCGHCATRYPTAAWDMQKFWYNVTKAGEVNYGCNGSDKG